MKWSTFSDLFLFHCSNWNSESQKFWTNKVLLSRRIFVHIKETTAHCWFYSEILFWFGLLRRTPTVRRLRAVSWSWCWTWDKVLLLLLSSSVRNLTVNLCLQPPRMDGRRRNEPQGAPIQFPLPTYPDSHEGSVQIVQVRIWIILIKNILWEIENNMKKYWIFWRIWREFWWRSQHEDEKSARS